MPETTIDTSAEAIAEWLTGRVAYYLDRPVTELQPDVKLVEYGLDSVYGMSLITEIEDRFDLELESTLAWDHPTIAAITGYLHGLVGQR
ncbi:acyl carrier protein [Kitasatospora sp. MBT63]|uniref:acyl carrier protein n=1 Tax=Kitasatospora sp. MBT63 TaxID=1444768 RepID=UPI0005396D42|nr:acyl carrier protein [Kitasatospora sp. MBT63]